MYVNYTGHFPLAVTGGHYFYIDKDYLMTIIAFCFGTMIIMYQVCPKLVWDLTDVDNREREYLTLTKRHEILQRIEKVMFAE